jgi:Flp pilus assembly protein TadD
MRKPGAWKRDEALDRLSGLADAGSADSAVYYLKGVILSEKGKREEALDFFRKAAAMEPEFPLYQFRLAETLHLLDKDPGEALTRAYTMDPDDPWTNNLRGLLALEAGEPGKAVAALGTAFAKAPGEVDILLNLAEAHARSGDTAGALGLLDGGERPDADKARIANAKGNILVEKDDFAAAVQAYELALRLDPANPVYMENCAAACLEVDMVHRAEELLSVLQVSNPSVSVYNLLGGTAMRKGEYQRAELAYTAGLVLEPANPEISANLAMLHLDRGRYPLAKELLEEALEKHPGHAGTAALIEKLRVRYETELSCSVCGRKWRVPKDLPLQPPLTVRGDLPGEAPAGRCPKCGKLFCISCAGANLVDMRFHCADCALPLKLSDNALRYLVNGYVEKAGGSP